MAITLTYSLDEDQFMHAVRVLWSYRGIGDRGNLIVAALSTLGGVAMLATGYGLGWLFVGAAVMFVAITALRNLIWRRSFPAMVKYTAPITARFSQSGVHTTSAQGDAQVPWSRFKSYAETPDYLFLFLGRRNFSIIPKSAANDPREIEDLRILITASLPRAKMRWT